MPFLTVERGFSGAALPLIKRLSMTAIATVLSWPALAQEAGLDEPAPVTEPADSGEGARTVEEIVVTAQRRQERLQDVPISITAISGDTLEKVGVNSVVNLPQTVPALRFDYSGAFVQPTIRGVGSPLAGPGQTSNVAVYLDGFYVPNALGTDFQLLNVSGVQVLKGPQGTLFGRNATGGAVLINTEDPSFTPSVKARFSYGSFDKTNVGFYGSTGVTDAVAVDFAGFFERGDGYVTNINTGDDAADYEKWAVRTKLLYEPNDTIRFIVGYAHNDNDDPTPAAQSLYDGLTAANPDQADDPGFPIATGPRETSNGFDVASTLESDEFNLRGEFDLGFADLKSLTMYRDEEARLYYDYDGTAVPVFSPDFRVLDETRSQEFDLSSKPGGRMNWVLGLFYYRNRNTYPAFNVSVGGEPFFKYFNTEVESESYAAFADATYQVLDDVFVTAGIRYGKDKVDELFYVDPANFGDTADETFDSWTPRANIRWQFSPSANIYASYNRGYKAGTFNPSGFSTEAVDPEHIDAYEIGFKGSNGRARYELAGFYYDYQDLQVASYIGTSAIINNAANSEVYGLEGQLSAALTDRFDITVAAMWLDASYDTYDTAVRYDQDTDPDSATYGTFVTSTDDASGNDMPRAPDFSGNIGLHYAQSAGSGMLDLNANYYYTTKVYFDSVSQFSQDGYGLLSLRATYTTGDGDWAFAVYGNNVTDEKYRNQVLPGSYAIQQTYGEPATAGVSVTYMY